MARPVWTIDAYETDAGEVLVQRFIEKLHGRDKTEAIALVKLLEGKGNELRRPHSGALDDGLFELRGKQVRLFYMFLPGRVAVLLDGEIKKQNAIPKKTLLRVRSYQKQVEARKSGRPLRRTPKK